MFRGGVFCALVLALRGRRRNILQELCLHNAVYDPGPVYVYRIPVGRVAVSEAVPAAVEVIAFGDSVLISIDPFPCVCQEAAVILRVAVALCCLPPFPGKG